MTNTFRQFAVIENTLDEALKYFKQREDCDDGVPNECNDG